MSTMAFDGQRDATFNNGIVAGAMAPVSEE